MDLFYVNKLLSVHKFKNTQNSWQAPAQRSVHYLAYIVSGKNTHTLKDKVLNVSADTLLFLNEADAYDVQIEELTESICINFRADTSTESFTIDCSSHPSVKKAFLNALAHRDISRTENSLLCLSCLYDILHFAERQTQGKERLPKSSRKLAPAMRYIEENYTDLQISIPQMAELCDISERRFTTLFSEIYGTSPVKYITEKKLAFAASLLAAQLYSVTDVSEMSGFSDIYYFSKTFKKHYGISPSEYKKSELKSR